MPSSLPSTAPAILLHEFATDLHSLSPTDVPVTRPGPGFVLIKVSHVAPTFGDGLVATGKYQTKPKLPFVPGTECAGIVVAVGEGVKNFKEGMRGTRRIHTP